MPPRVVGGEEARVMRTMSAIVASADSGCRDSSNVSQQLFTLGVSCHEAGTQGVKTWGTQQVAAIFDTTLHDGHRR